jgi:hypothetical protein
VSPDSRIDSRFSPLPIVDSPVFVLEENARAREAQHLPKPTDEDFLARDLRKLADAENKLALRCQAAIGSGTRMTEEQFFEVACELAGIAVKRGLEVKAWGKKWPAQEGSA